MQHSLYFRSIDFYIHSFEHANNIAATKCLEELIAKLSARHGSQDGTTTTTCVPYEASLLQNDPRRRYRSIPLGVQPLAQIRTPPVQRFLRRHCYGLVYAFSPSAGSRRQTPWRPPY